MFFYREKRLFVVKNDYTKRLSWCVFLIFLHGLCFRFFAHVPYALDVHDAECAVVEAVAGAALFAPDVAAVVGAVVAFKADVVVGAHDFGDVYRAVG